MVSLPLQDKVNILWDILVHYEILSPVNKEEQPLGENFINPVIILAKGESLKIVLDARNLKMQLDHRTNQRNTHKNGQNYARVDRNSVYNQMALEKQPRPLTHFVIGNQQYEFYRLLRHIYRTSSFLCFFEWNFLIINFN